MNHARVSSRVAPGILALTVALTASSSGQERPPELAVAREVKLVDLLGERPEPYEASGVLRLPDGDLVVAFDNLHALARIAPDLEAGALGPAPEERRGSSDFEGLARDPESGDLYVAIESTRRDGAWRAGIVALDASLRPRGEPVWLEPANPSGGKGCEGLAVVRRGGRAWLLVLMEGNHAASGRRGREAGHGRVRVYGADEAGWTHAATLSLPPECAMEDYAGLDVGADGRLAVVSQSSSLLWVGRLRDAAWEVDGPGRLFRFPRDGAGRRVYGNVEGVAWLDDRRLVVVSDEAKDDQPEAVAKDQSIHVVRLPDR